MSKKLKFETLEEYLARGKTITKLPTVQPEAQPEPARKPQAGGAVTILSLEEADLFYGEANKKKKTKSKVTPTIDISALPESLRAKFVNKLQEEMSEEADQESQDSEEE